MTLDKELDVYAYSTTKATEIDGEYKGRNCVAIDFAYVEHGCPVKGLGRFPQALQTCTWIHRNTNEDETRLSCRDLNCAKKLIKEAVDLTGPNLEIVP